MSSCVLPDPTDLLFAQVHLHLVPLNPFYTPHFSHEGGPFSLLL